MHPMCPRCGSLGRHRTQWLYLAQRPELLAGPKEVLQGVAPERSLQHCLRRFPEIDYLSADYDAKTAMEQMDITDIHYSDSSFDVIICNHVLEHVSDDARALREMFRVLRPGGWALLQVPIDFDREHTFEDAGITDPRERERAFGQFDHVSDAMELITSSASKASDSSSRSTTSSSGFPRRRSTRTASSVSSSISGGSPKID